MKIEKIILIVISSILILTAFEVKAEESINIDNSYASYRTITNCNGTISGFTQLDLNESSGNLTANNSYNRPFLYQLRLFSQADFKKSNSYTISYNINLSWINVNTSVTPPNTQTYVDILKNANPKISARVDSGSSWLPDNLETYNVSYNYVSGNIVNVIIKFSLKQDAQYVGVLFDWSGRNQCAWDGYFYEWLITALRLSAASGTYEMGTIGAIENQTNAIINGNNQINNNLDNINGSINDSNVSESENAFGEFFNGFSTNTHGLTGVITSPLQLIGSITSSTCSDLVLPLPYVNKNLTLPCMSSIYYNFFGNFFTLYQRITFGIISYWVVIRIFNLVKDFKNPEHDEIEVMDL